MVNKVAVVGSANVDIVIEVPWRPSAGETLLGSDLHLYAGGKGANQAAAASRAGATTRFVANVGADSHGAFLREQLQEAGVDVTSMRTVDRPTGTALILLTPDGENSIVVSPGANRSLDVAAADATAATWTDSDVVVLNLETPLPTVEHVAQRAAAAGVRVLLNAAPAEMLSSRTLALCDPLVVNEHEARSLLNDSTSTFTELSRQFLAAGVRSVVITLGSAGSVVADREGINAVAAHSVRAIDTTGAGDAFVGATACELAAGKALRDAIRFATAMSALSVQSMGAQPSYPNLAQVQEFLSTARGLLVVEE